MKERRHYPRRNPGNHIDRRGPATEEIVRPDRAFTDQFGRVLPPLPKPEKPLPKGGRPCSKS